MGNGKIGEPVKKRMDRDELSRFVSVKIAEALPVGFVEECICDAIERHLTDFRIEEFEIRAAMKEVVLAKTKELLKTRYMTQIEVKADELAQKALAGR